jgi:hypothetical protein
VEKKLAKREKVLADMGASKSFFWHNEDCFSEKAMLRQPARMLCELDALAKAQIIESEEWLLLQG